MTGVKHDCSNCGANGWHNTRLYVRMKIHGSTQFKGMGWFCLKCLNLEIDAIKKSA